MILKIRGIENGQWWIYDNLVKVKYDRLKTYEIVTGIDTTGYKEVKMDKVTPFIPDVEILINPPIEKESSNKQQKINAILIIARDNRDREISILFDTIAYLCNDEGKTIEKITA